MKKKPYWVKYEFDDEDPMCVKCGVPLFLEDGCEWSLPEFNLCHGCALEIIEKDYETTS